MMKSNSSEIFPIHEKLVSRKQREQFLNQKSKVIWMTGLSGSGKSTIAAALEKKLFENNFFAQVLDGDNIRGGINNNLGFSIEDRKENVRRIAEVSKLYAESGIICICSFISPTEEIRAFAREIIGNENFLEIFVSTPLHICEKRDVKGLYKKARKGEIINFTGIDSPYENPKNPDLILSTEFSDIDESVNLTYQFLQKHISFN